MGTLDDNIESVLYSSEEISRRVSELASQITSDLDNNNTNNTESSPPVVVVGVATGAFLFLADLVRNIKLPITVDFIRAESYGSGTVSSGDPRISSDLKMDILGKHVILVFLSSNLFASKLFDTSIYLDSRCYCDSFGLVFGKSPVILFVLCFVGFICEYLRATPREVSNFYTRTRQTGTF